MRRQGEFVTGNISDISRQSVERAVGVGFARLIILLVMNQRCESIGITKTILEGVRQRQSK